MPISAPLQVVYRPVAGIIEYANNARTHSAKQVDQIAASIREFGFTSPALIDENGTLIAGHGRLAAAKKLGLVEIPTITLAGLSDAQRKALVLADNRIQLSGGWDENLLKIEIEALIESEFDVSLLGFDDKELAGLTAAPSTEGLTDPDETPDVPQEPASELGDVWILGKHRLVCGDSTDPAVVAALMAGGMADLIHTDPPYGVTYKGGAKKRKQIENDEKTGADLTGFLTAAFGAGLKHAKAGAPMYVWHADKTVAQFEAALVAVGRSVSAHIIWVKNVLAGGWGDYRARHETCLYVRGESSPWYGGRDQDTVWNVAKETDYVHPTQKPVELIERVLKNSSKSGDVVLDLFGGSGSTLIACDRLSREARLMELDCGYCDVIVTRWEKHSGQQAVLEETGETFLQVLARRRPNAHIDAKKGE